MEHELVRFSSIPVFDGPGNELVQRTLYHLRKLRFAEFEQLKIALSCVRPVYFQGGADQFFWGNGTQLVCMYERFIFAASAKHVFTNTGADPMHQRLLFPGFSQAVPIARCFVVQEQTDAEDEDDFLLSLVDPGLGIFGSERILFQTWDMKDRVISADALPNGTKLFALSYPATDDRYDFDHLTSTETPLIATGTLRRPSNLAAEVFTMECDELLIPMNGASGGAVMALVDGTIYYAGMMIRSTQSSRLIHFINAARISETIGWIVDKLKPCNLDNPAYIQHANV